MRGSIKIEHEITEPCVLWENTRDMARDKGLELIGGCPLENYCKGPDCVLLTPEEEDKKMVKEKLTDLRRELRSLG